MKRKHLTETPVCPQERLVIISYTTYLSFALERIGPLAAIIITVFYLLALYLFALPNTPENPSASIYSESFIKTTCQHLLLLVGFDTLIYQKYYDIPPILVGYHICTLSLFYQLPNCNLFTQHVDYLFYGETPLVNCGPRSNFLYIAITYLLLLALFTFSHTNIAFHSIRSYLCL
jgi:hypothetical protein